MKEKPRIVPKEITDLANKMRDAIAKDQQFIAVRRRRSGFTQAVAIATAQDIEVEEIKKGSKN